MTALLRLESVSKSYGALRVIEGVSLEVASGEALGVIGPNGAGKSTLFNLITGTVAGDGGRIWFDGRDLTRAPPYLRARAGIARSWQIPHPLAKMTVFENLLADAGERERAAQCVDILEQTGLARLANAPTGRLTLLERKRLELARALAMRPRLLLLDEIAGGLTEHECDTLVETVRSVHGTGTTIVWIEHVVHALLAAIDRLLVLNFGRLLAAGDPKLVMSSPEVREVYMGIGG